MSTPLRRAALSIAAGGGLAVLGILMGPAGSASAAPVGIDLYAENGTTDLPGTGGAGMPVLGYCTSTPCTVTAPGGPTLRVAQGSAVTITLHNGLAGEATSFYVGGQAMVPDTAAVAAGGDHQYTFTADRPGTYLYEAGVGAGSQHQVARGLFGALVVEPATAGQAYDASTAFDTDAVLVLSEVDSRLNRSTTPADFDMRSFAPQWALVNGSPAPGTAPVTATSGSDVLLRWVNAGTGYHSMAVLGADQRVVALDGSQLKNGAVDISRRYVAETFGPGQTADAIVTVPATAADRRLAVYDASLTLHNTNAAGTGGMLTFLRVTGSGRGTDVSGPATRGVAWSGTALSGTVDATAITGANVSGAEYFVDTVGAPGTGTAMEATDGAFGSDTEAVRPTAATASALATTLSAGQHVVYVRGLSGTAWGPFSSVLVMGSDAVGPTTSGVTLTPDHSNGSGDVALAATGNDTASGNSAIGGAEWAIDGGTATAMSLQTTGPVASVVGSIPAATVAGLGEGTHTVTVRTRDVVGNWSQPVGVPLVADRTAPTAQNVTVNPSPNNGTMPVNGTSASVRVSATITDPAVGSDGTAQSTITAARGYLDTSTTPIVMEAADGAYSGTTENVYLEIPLATVKLADGSHTITVQGRDAAGNWGSLTSGTLVVDKTGPVITGLGLTPNPTNGATQVTLTGTATDVVGTVSRVEWFIGTGTPATATLGAGGTFTATIPLATYTEGDYTVTVRGFDVLGNRSATNATVVLHLTPSLWFSTAGNTNPPGVAGTADDADIFHWTGSRFGRTIDASAGPYNLPASGGGNANVDGFSRVDATHFYLSFTGQVSVPGLGDVQDEDVVYWNNGTWQLFFDGSANGNGVSGFDLDAISVRGGRLYFSVDSNTAPPGVVGAGDDSDIYVWNPGVTPRYTRVVVATSIGVPANANVDGFVWRSATDYLFSFSGDTTVSGLGATQDEDVVRRTGTVWSVYFDGTARGLTSNNLDVDAFDIP